MAMVTHLWRLAKHSPELRYRLLSLIATALVVMILIGMAIAVLV